jgi:hypothetical protein
MLLIKNLNFIIKNPNIRKGIVNYPFGSWKIHLINLEFSFVDKEVLNFNKPCLPINPSRWYILTCSFRSIRSLGYKLLRFGQKI